MVDDGLSDMIENPAGFLDFTSSDERFNAGLILKTGFSYDFGKSGPSDCDTLQAFFDEHCLQFTEKCHRHPSG